MGRFRNRVALVAVAATACALIAGSAAAATATAKGRAATARIVTATPPVKASVRIYLPDAAFVSHHAVTVPGRAVRIGAVVRPYVPGQSVKVRVIQSGRMIKSVRLPLKPSGDRRYGHTSLTISSSRPGTLHVLVGHSRNAHMQSFLASRPLTVLDVSGVGFGSSGLFVQLIQQQLAVLHFYIPRTGVYDQGTGLALDAYHRLLRWGTYQTLDERTISALLDRKGRFPVRYPRSGKHVEANLSTQLLALINGTQVYWILPMSSGKPSTPTPPGRYSVKLKTPGLLPDGMFYSSFFLIRGAGFAIHGYDPAPDYPASHGCLRLPMRDAIPVYNWLQIGDGVDVYN